MPRILVTYATNSGCTSSLAEAVAEALRAENIAVELADIRSEPDPSGFDAVIVGSGVRDGSWHTDATRWLNNHADSLRTMPLALFTVSLAIRNPDKTDSVRQYTAPTLAALGLTPVSIGLFAGWNRPQEFSGTEREFMEKFEDKGDWRDFDAVRAWAGQIAPQLTAG